MHWNDPFSKQHQVSFAIESTLCDQFPFLCHLVFSSVISLTTSLYLWRRYNLPILCCTVRSLTGPWHHFCTDVLISGLPYVRNNMLIFDLHTSIFQASLTLYVLPLVTESKISDPFHYPFDNNQGVSLHFQYFSVSDQVLVPILCIRLLLTAFLRELQLFSVTILPWAEATSFAVDCPPWGCLLKFVAVSVTAVYNFGRAPW